VFRLRLDAKPQFAGFYSHIVLLISDSSLDSNNHCLGPRLLSFPQSPYAQAYEAYDEVVISFAEIKLKSKYIVRNFQMSYLEPISKPHIFSNR
jgi:hypothetical protein